LYRLAYTLLGWTQEEIAKATGVPRGTISNVVLEISKLKNSTVDQHSRGRTVSQIAESEDVPDKAVLDKVATQVLDLARQHQTERVTEEVTDVTFDFTEWWFRTSGLYDFPVDFYYFSEYFFHNFGDYFYYAY